MILFLFEDTFSNNSLATLTDGSTGNTIPLFPIMSDTWLTVVPVDAPKYSTFDDSLMGFSLSPFNIAPASLLLNGSHNLYSISSFFIIFSPYTLLPLMRFCVARYFSFVLLIKITYEPLSNLLMNI